MKNWKFAKNCWFKKNCFEPIQFFLNQNIFSWIKQFLFLSGIRFWPQREKIVLNQNIFYLSNNFSLFSFRGESRKKKKCFPIFIYYICFTDCLMFFVVYSVYWFGCWCFMIFTDSLLFIYWWLIEMYWIFTGKLVKFTDHLPINY